MRRATVDPAWFSAVMGTAGTAGVLAVNPLQQDYLRGAAQGLAWALFVVAAVGFAALTVRLIAADVDIWAEMGSPGSGPSYATIPGAMMVLIVALTTLVTPEAVTGAWWWAALAWNTAGAALAVLVTVRLFVAAFVHETFPVEQLSGAWFVPETALLLSGMVAGRLALPGPVGWNEALVVAAFALAGAGLVLFSLTAAVFFTRLILFRHVPAHGAPEMWIMLSPLSISALALHQVGTDAALLDARIGSDLVAVSDMVAMLLWGFSLWWIFAAAAITWRARRAAITHRPADWAYVFPPAALALSTQTLAMVWESAALHVLAAVFALVLFALWTAVTADTARHLAARVRGRRR